MWYCSIPVCQSRYQWHYSQWHHSRFPRCIERFWFVFFCVNFITAFRATEIVHRSLPPFIRRDYDCRPIKLQLLQDLIAYHHRCWIARVFFTYIDLYFQLSVCLKILIESTNLLLPRLELVQKFETLVNRKCMLEWVVINSALHNLDSLLKYYLQSTCKIHLHLRLLGCWLQVWLCLVILGQGNRLGWSLTL